MQGCKLFSRSKPFKLMDGFFLFARLDSSVTVQKLVRFPGCLSTPIRQMHQSRQPET